jgi:hypothetical protein
VFALLLIFGEGSPALAWNDFGHMTAAALAFEQLTPAARSGTAQLLRLNPSYPEWVAGVSPAERDEVAFVRAATWADWIKHAPGYIDDGQQPVAADAARNIGYADHLQHRYWHYIDVPFTPDHTPTRPAAHPNAQTQISAFQRTLSSLHASPALKSYDLVWLLHLVADVHQPLHVTARFTHELPQGDAGGNRIALCAPPCRRELHAFWDGALGHSSNPRRARVLARELPPPPAALAAIADPARWVEETHALALSAVYVDPIGNGAGPYALTRAYTVQARALARERIALAGARLANLLNQAFR